MHWKTPYQISERDKRLLMALAGQAALSIENANLFDQLKADNVRRNEESKSLQAVGISLTESIQLEEVLQQVLQAALGLIDGDEDTILFYDEGRDEFRTEALMCTGLNQPLTKYATKVRQRAGLAYEIVKQRLPISIPDTLADPRTSPVAIEKGRLATVGVPLLDHDGPVGVLWVNWKKTRQISSRETSLLTALASQATVAIQAARRYEEIQRRSAELQRRSAHLQAVHEAGKVISAASVGLDKQQVLDRILEQAIECVTGLLGPAASVGTIQLLDEETHELVVMSVFPPQDSKRFTDKLDSIPLDPQKPRTGRIGVSGRAALTRQPQLVPDVSKDDDYIVYSEKTKSELAIPMLENDRVIGVMDVESSELNAFDQLDRESLSLLVDLALVALRNAEQADQLTRSNAVGLMGAWAAEVVHGIHREVGVIRREVFWLQQQPEASAKIKESFALIDQAAARLAQPEIPERLPGYEAVTLPDFCQLDEIIQGVVQTYQSKHPSIAFRFEPGCPEIPVAMHERFVHSIFRNLLRNAAFALLRDDVTEKTVCIRSRVEGSMAVIDLENSGPKLRSNILPYLFKRLIPHDDGRKGRGLLLVGFIVEQHAGRIEIVQNEQEKGVLFRLWLPLHQERKTL
jgi:GAF domain-containing protein